MAHLRRIGKQDQSIGQLVTPSKSNEFGGGRVGLALLRQLQSETQMELDALLPSVLDRAFKGEL